MWWQQNACLWLNGPSVHLLKTKRTWYGHVAFRQGHRDYERAWGPDWMGQERTVQTHLPKLLQQYGLTGWRLRILVGGPSVLWKRLSLGTPNRQEADALIDGAGLISEEGRAYDFEAACPAQGDDGLYAWTVGAYPADCITAICQAASAVGAIVQSIDLVPAFLAAFGQLARGPWFFRKPQTAGSTGSACATACPWPMTYRLLWRQLMGRLSAGSQTGWMKGPGSLPGRVKPCAV